MPIPAETAKHCNAALRMSRNSWWLCGPRNFSSSWPTVTVRPRAGRTSARYDVFDLCAHAYASSTYAKADPCAAQAGAATTLHGIPKSVQTRTASGHFRQLPVPVCASLSSFYIAASGRRAVTVAILLTAQGFFKRLHLLARTT